MAWLGVNSRQVIRNDIIVLITLCVILIPAAFPRALFDTTQSVNPPLKSNQGNTPFISIGVHNIGRIAMTVSNQGHFGKGFIPGVANPIGGGDAPSCTYPYPGNLSYLFAGSFWIGAVVGRDTLVSVGADGWHDIKELWPDPEPRGRIIHRSISGENAEDAISEQDYIAIYTDTLTDRLAVHEDAFSGRPHVPLGIEVTQRSYAWSYPYAEDFILFDYSIKNLNYLTLYDVYMGFYVDGDVNFVGSSAGYDDDICGFKRSIPSPYGCGFIDTINIAWIADNDGKEFKDFPCPYNESSSLTALTGMRVVRTPSDSLNYSFNWWISNGSAALDFGPRMFGTPDDPFRDFGGFLGTPEGDKNKYYVMRHEEFDYDQLFCALDHTDEGWLPADDRAADFADGFDTRYLLSFGPFEIEPGEVLPISFAYIAGENFHTDCEAFTNLFDADDPYLFYNQLDFEDLGTNAAWASWLYDNPGYDTDGDGYSGKFRICPYDSVLIDTSNGSLAESVWVYTLADTIYYEGDGIPDFRGAAPPLAPELWILDSLGDTVRARIYPRVTQYNSGELCVRWNGYNSETVKDVFSNLIDFEGYRVYYSETPYAHDFIMVASYDIEDFNKFVRNTDRGIWELHDPPFSRDFLIALYNWPDDFDPTKYTREYPFKWMDSIFYFTEQDWNQDELNDTLGIHKVYPEVSPPTTLNLDSARIYFPEELTPEGYFKYYEYEYVLRNLLPSRLYYVAVTAFDYGSPGHDLQSLETSPTRNYVAEYAQNTNSVVEQRGLEIIVYPNPYRADGNYRANGFEGVDYIDSTMGGTLVAQNRMIDDRTRSIHFTNLPHRCTIRIFTIDGDLVREIEHNYPKDTPRSMHERWDMITRNTQPVVSGIYYWVVESDSGSQMGKLVIIK